MQRDKYQQMQLGGSPTQRDPNMEGPHPNIEGPPKHNVEQENTDPQGHILHDQIDSLYRCA